MGLLNKSSNKIALLLKMIGGGLLNRHLFAFCSQTRKLTLIRNGETIWNKDKKWVGWVDVPLSSFGIKEVK